MTVRVFIVDDSPFIREFLGEIISSEKDFQVAGYAANGKEACDRIGELKPDVVLMDIHMPVMSGTEATAWIMQHHPVPIIVVTSDDTKETALRAMESGALEVVLKPTINDIEKQDELQNFIATIRSVSAIQMKPPLSAVKTLTENDTKKAPVKTKRPVADLEYQVIAVASSTGGPKVLHEIMPALESIPVPIVITQHVNRDFADQFVQWMGKAVSRTVKLADDGEILKPDHIYFAPPDVHLEIGKGHLKYNDEPRLNFQKPSADYMFSSLAKSYGKKSIAVILTGMGKDGAAGMLKVHRAGGYTIAQDETTCVVYGMPKEAVMLQAVRDILPYYQIPGRIRELMKL